MERIANLPAIPLQQDNYGDDNHDYHNGDGSDEEYDPVRLFLQRVEAKNSVFRAMVARRHY